MMATWYARKGWPRDGNSWWRKWIRICIGAILGVYVFGQVAILATKGPTVSTPVTPTNAMSSWVSKHLVPNLNFIESDLSVFKKAESSHSWISLNNACLNGAARAEYVGGTAPAPNRNFQFQYHAWLVDLYQMFSYCQEATATQTQWLSAAGTADWKKAMSYAIESDSAYVKLLSLAKHLNP